MTISIPDSCRPVCQGSGYDFLSAADRFISAVDLGRADPVDIFQIARDLNYYANSGGEESFFHHLCLRSCFEDAVAERLISAGREPGRSYKKDSMSRDYPLPLSLMIGKLQAGELQLAADLFGYDYFAGFTGWRKTLLEIGTFIAVAAGCVYGILTGVSAGTDPLSLGLGYKGRSPTEEYL